VGWLGYVVVNDHERRAVLLREGLKLSLRHVARGLLTGAAAASTQARNVPVGKPALRHADI
jgi:hypothetical protein